MSTIPFSSGWSQLKCLPTQVSCRVRNSTAHPYGLELSHAPTLHIQGLGSCGMPVLVGLLSGLYDTLPSEACHSTSCQPSLQPVTLRQCSGPPLEHCGWVKGSQKGRQPSHGACRGHAPMVPLSNICKWFFILFNFWEQKSRHIL